MSVGVVRETVLSTLREALEDARASGDLKLTTLPALVLDVPKKTAWGDLATTVAMNLAASERRAPHERPTSFRKAASSSVGTPSRRASSALEPGSSPTTT